MKTAIILGATGLTGSFVLSQLLENENYDKVKVFSRNTVGFSHPKLDEYLVDVLKLEKVVAEFTADEVYCCIGTTKKKTPDQESYHVIDFGIPVSAAKMCKENGISVFSVVSAIGANPDSSIFYNRTKGEMEAEVQKIGVERTYILRPSIIGGNRNESRLGEKIGLAVFKLVKPLLVGRLKKYAMVEASAIARRMIKLANSNKKSCVLESNEI